MEARFSNRQKVITEQYMNPDKVYFLMRGKCKIEKNLHYNDEGVSQNKTIHICDVDYKGIFGEEILFETDTEKYHYTVTVVSEEALFFTVTKSAILGNFPKEIKAYLYETFLLKRNMRREIFEKVSKNVLETTRIPEIQTMIELKLGEKEKIIKNMNTGLRLNYYQKLKNTVNEDFLNNGGSKTAKNWDSELIFDSLKRSILEKKGLEKIMKAQKMEKTDAINQCLIRKAEKKNEIVEDLGEISNCYLVEDGRKRSPNTRNSEILDREHLVFNFNGEQHNHRYFLEFIGEKRGGGGSTICKKNNIKNWVGGGLKFLKKQ